MVANHMAQHVFTGLVKSLNHTRCLWVPRCIKTRATPQLRKHFTSQSAGKICALVTYHDFWYPYVGKKSIKASHAALAVNDFNMYTEDQRVQLSTTHRQYLWPWNDGGSNEPMQSMFMTWKVTSVRLIGVIGTRSVVIGLDRNWHSQHGCTWVRTLLRKPGQ